MKFTAAGDMLIQRRVPMVYEGLPELIDYIEQGDARYFNLETTLHGEGECFGSQFSGGSYLRADPEVLEDCADLGFNMLSFCNNHSMDFSYRGLEKTLAYIKQAGFVQAGVGMNMGEAAAPAYLDLPDGRVALIGAVSTCDPSCMAGEQSRRVPGRPGVNRIRFQETIVVTEAQMAAVREIAALSHVNAQEDIERAEGYHDPTPEGFFDFGPVRFQLGEETARRTACNPNDLARVKKAIFEAQLQADYILVTIHSHEISGESKENPSEFLVEFARACIDAGADAIIGHGPHLLRPIEIYHGKPIFYSLGDFFMENESIPFGPEDFFSKHGLTSNATMHDLFAARSKGFTRGLQAKPVMFEAIIPYWEMQDGKLVKLELAPVELGFDLPRSQKGRPRLAQNDAILQRLKKMSAPYGTRMEINGNRAIVIF